MPWKPSVSLSTVSAMLHGQLITVKKLESPETNRNSPAVKEARREYAVWLNSLQASLDDPEVVFFGESGFSLWLARTRGRARTGQRAVRIVGNRRGPNFSCLMALSNIRGIIHSDIRMGGTTAAVFNEFLRQSSSRIDGPTTLVLDNAPCHRSVRDSTIPEHNVVRFLPPYSPFLNIVENAWSVWKAALKAQLAEFQTYLISLNAYMITPELQSVCICHQALRMIAEKKIFELKA